MTIRHLTLPSATDILLAVTHLSSKQYQDESDQMVECNKLAKEIGQAEKSIGHSRTILVGDLNMNPFEEGLVLTHGLHAVMSRNVASRKSRVVQDTSYPFFYNPMWSLMGDLSNGPAGTYYYSGSNHKTYFWNTFDQVLIRPSLINSFVENELEIIQSDGITSFLSKQNIPDKNHFSDHLPIRFTLQH